MVSNQIEIVSSQPVMAGCSMVFFYNLQKLQFNQCKTGHSKYTDVEKMDMLHI